MFLKNHFAGNAKGNMLLALKVDIAKTRFLVFYSDIAWTRINHLTLYISDARCSGRDIYQ